MNKELILSNLREIVRAAPGTYASYVAQTTINHMCDVTRQPAFYFDEGCTYMIQENGMISLSVRLDPKGKYNNPLFRD